MRRSLTVAVAGLLIAGTVVGTALTTGTAARFVDTEAGAPGVASAATVVLGDRSTPVALAFGGVRPGGSRTVNLRVVYRGTVPAEVQIRLPAGASATACQGGGTTSTDPPLGGTLTLTAGSLVGASWCGLLDGAARTVLATVRPGSTTTVPVTVALSSFALVSRTERAQVAVRAVGGFTDQVLGTITITTSALFGGRSVALPAPPVTTTTAAPAPVVPAACTGGYAETIVLAGDRPRFVAAEDRPGGTGPYLVIGTAGDDTVVGSEAGDCVVGGDGADVLDGAGGDDVLLGDAGSDRLTGGPGADVLDGGADLADCDTDPADRTTGCRADPGTDPGTGAGVADPTSPAPTTAAPTTGPTTPVTTSAPPPTTDPALATPTGEEQPSST